MWIHNSIEASAGADGKCYKTWRNRERSDLFCVARGRDVRNFCADKVSALARILPNTHDLRCEDISARMFDHPADLYREIRSCRDYASWWRLTVGGMRERERERNCQRRDRMGGETGEINEEWRRSVAMGTKFGIHLYG